MMGSTRAYNSPNRARNRPRADVNDLSPALIECLRNELDSRLDACTDRHAGSILALSERFTRGLDQAPGAYLDEPDLLQAYLAYYLPVNAAKIAMLLAEMPAIDLHGRDAQEPIRVLELGGGPGTGLLPLVQWYAQQPWHDALPLRIVSVDRSARALEVGNRLSKKFIDRLGLTQVTVRSVQADLEKPVFSHGKSHRIIDGPFDIVLVANSLNELFRRSPDPVQMRVGFLRTYLQAMADSGTCMLLEPALRPVARELHRLRDALVGSGACTVYSPCLHNRSCPALVNPHDWCHEERSWTAPDWVAVLDRRVGFIKDALKFSYLLLRKDGKTIVQRQPNVYRVVSELRSMKGDQRAWLCNEKGRSEVGRLARERSETNAAVDEWHRGAIVRISEIVRKERKGRETTVGRIPASTTVEIIQSI